LAKATRADAASDPDSFDAKVNAIVDRRLQQLKKVSYSFLLGLGFLAVLIVGNGLLAKDALIVTLHNEIFSLRKSLNAVLGNQVAFSFADQFRLQLPSERYRDVTFYLRKGQIANLYFSVKHSGSGTPAVVRISLAGAAEPVWRSDQDTEGFEPRVLAKYISRDRPMEASIQVLKVAMESDAASQDVVFVRTVVTIVGLEES
jgi:hypothetical protein